MTLGAFVSQLKFDEKIRTQSTLLPLYDLPWNQLSYPFPQTHFSICLLQKWVHHLKWLRRKYVYVACGYIIFR